MAGWDKVKIKKKKKPEKEHDGVREDHGIGQTYVLFLLPPSGQLSISAAGDTKTIQAFYISTHHLHSPPPDFVPFMSLLKLNRL